MRSFTMHEVPAQPAHVVTNRQRYEDRHAKICQRAEQCFAEAHDEC